jgi:hypothetical protein
MKILKTLYYNLKINKQFKTLTKKKKKKLTV